MADLDFEVRAFQPEDARAFADLNRRWIEQLFGMEEEDWRVLRSPQETILDPGGYIAIAEEGGKVIATGALMVPSHNSLSARSFELVKMATAPIAQGQGVAAAVLDHLIAYAKERGAQSIWLETNDKLAAATRLYKRKGFQTLSKNEQRPSPFSRCNLQLEVTL